MLCPRARCVHDCACCSHDRCWCCCAGSRRGAAPCTGGRAACDAAAVAVNGAVCGGSRAPSSPRRRARSPAAGAPPSPRWCCRRAAATAARLALSHSLQNLGGSTSCKSCSPTHPFAPSRFAMCDTGRVPRAARPPPGGPASRGGGGQAGYSTRCCTVQTTGVSHCLGAPAADQTVSRKAWSSSAAVSHLRQRRRL
jgi:hypothetical protein